jgi:hypothetical protein
MIIPSKSHLFSDQIISIKSSKNRLSFNSFNLPRVNGKEVIFWYHSER